MSIKPISHFESEGDVNAERLNILVDEIRRLSGGEIVEISKTINVSGSGSAVGSGTGVLDGLKDNAGSLVNPISGRIQLTDDGNINADRSASNKINITLAVNISVDKVAALSSSGLLLVDDSGNGIFVKDNGCVAIGASITDADGRLHLINDNTSFKVFFDSYQSNLSCMQLVGRHARGTKATPTAIVNRDRIMFLGSSGHDGDGFTGTESAVMLMRATEDWSAGNHGTKIEFDVTKNGTVTRIGACKFLDNGVVKTYRGRISNTTRIINTASPYTILDSDHIIFVDTDGGVVTANLPAGVEGTHYKIINCGSSGNNVTVDPNGTEQLFGAGAGVAHALTDGNSIDIHYEAIEGWMGSHNSVADLEGQIKRCNLEILFDTTRNTAYHEMTYNGSGDITNVDIWVTNAKTTKLFSRVISYDAGNIDEIMTTDEINSKTLTKTITYNGGNINTITKVIA